MGYEPQRFVAPDGTEMIVLPASQYERLRALAEEGEDIADALAIQSRIDTGEGTLPSEVLNLMLDQGLKPLAAWRRHRNLSQSELARRAGLSQVWINRLEAGRGYGSRDTRRRLAEALNAPIWTLEELDDSVRDDVATSKVGRKGSKYLPLQDHLSRTTRDVVTLRFGEIADLVGGLPKSAEMHRAWWGNHAGNSQAIGWISAGYRAEPDMSHRSVTFRRSR